MTALHRLQTVAVFDADGNELVGIWRLVGWNLTTATAPDPVGVFNGQPVWRRADVEPLTLFNESAS